MAEGTHSYQQSCKKLFCQTSSIGTVSTVAIMQNNPFLLPGVHHFVCLFVHWFLVVPVIYAYKLMHSHCHSKNSVPILHILTPSLFSIGTTIFKKLPIMRPNKPQIYK